jgi:flagellin-like hook-associated protein FlgL
MSLVVGTNVSALYSQNALKTNARSTSTAMERLSTGVRVNSAKDDAAGLAIGQNMTSQIRGLNQAVRNINDGINLVQIAEGGLNSVSNMLQRMRELAVQASNGTYSDVQRGYLNQECQQLQTAISQVVDTTMWNDQKLLDGSFSQPIQIGSDVDTKMAVEIPGSSLGALGLGSTMNTEVVTKAWTKLLGSALDEGGHALATGLDGAIFVSGFTSGNLDGEINIGGRAAFIAKFNADGSKVWTKLFGSGDTTAMASTTGLDGSIYVSGYTGSSIDGLIYGGGYVDAFITKYRSDGTKAWTRSLGSSVNESGNALTTGLDGSIYMSGYADGNLDGETSNGLTDAFIAKFNSDGSKAWTKLWGGNGRDYGSALTTGLDGSIYMSGTTDGNLEGQTNSGGNAAFITKYNTDGTKAWTRILGTSVNTGSAAITTGLDGSIYISGVTDGNLDGQTNSGGYDAFISKYNTDGTKAWTRLLGSGSLDGASAVTTGLDGSIYLSGNTTGNLDGYANSGVLDSFITKFNADGTKVWTKLLGSSSDDTGRALTTGIDGAIYVSGMTQGNLDGETNTGSWDAYITKFSDTSTSTTSTTDISTAASAASSISAIDEAINMTNVSRATLGSYINRLAYAADNVTNISSNATQSRSTIVDADYAIETTNLAKNQIIQQAATAMLAQANTQAQAVMALLKNA